MKILETYFGGEEETDSEINPNLVVDAGGMQQVNSALTFLYHSLASSSSLLGVSSMALGPPRAAKALAREEASTFEILPQYWMGECMYISMMFVHNHYFIRLG